MSLPIPPRQVAPGYAPAMARLLLQTLPDLPIIHPGDDLAASIAAALQRARIQLQDGDVLAVASKLISRAAGRFVSLPSVEVSERASALAREVGKEPALVELILREARALSRRAPGALIVRSRLGVVAANAGIDRSNASPPPDWGEGPWALLLPEDPDAEARALRRRLGAGLKLGVVITDSLGRPFRLGTLGHALGLAGLPALHDQRGRPDLFSRPLQHTCTGLADAVAAAADLLAGQADEGTGVVHLRGLRWKEPDEPSSAAQLQRPPERDLYA